MKGGVGGSNGESMPYIAMPGYTGIAYGFDQTG